MRSEPEDNAEMARPLKLLVAGASSGIGRAVAIAAATRGMRCVLVARREDELERTRAMMANPEAHSVAAIDFADADGRDLALMRLFTAEGPFDGIVYTVGVCPVAPIARLDAAAFEETMRVNWNVWFRDADETTRPCPDAGV